MKAASPAKNTITFLSRRAMASIAGALTVTVLGLAVAPDLRAETPPDQIKAAGAISLTTELVNKMDRFMKSVSTDAAAKAELAAVDKEPSNTPEAWGSVISAKCPKVVVLFKASGLTPDEFARGIFALMAVALNEGLTTSENKTIQANVAFVAGNKDRADAILSAFLMFGEPSSPVSAPRAEL